jgi:hypothetical protein
VRPHPSFIIIDIERFWGWTENEREVKMDMEEMTAKLRAGKPLYGKSGMDLYHQQIAASQSRYAQLKFRTLTPSKFSRLADDRIFSLL